MDYSDIQVQKAGELVQSFMTISKTLTKFTAQNAASLGLTILQMGILNTINAFPEITLKEVADRLQLAKSSVSVNVESLVKLELVDRKTPAQNRREVQLSSTVKGQELAGKSSQNALSYRAMMYALQNMPNDDVQTLLRIHHDLLAHLNKVKF